MNILVCFKAAPKVDRMTYPDWRFDDNLQVDTSFLQPTLNSYEESALEMALMFSDAAGTIPMAVKLSALTIADTGANTILKTLKALPFKPVVRIDNGHMDLRFSPMAVASVLSQYVIDHAPQDVLIMGRQTRIGENAKTHLLVSEMLGWPCITQVIRIDPVDQNHLMVTSRVDDGKLLQQIKTPCVLSIGDAPKTHMRLPTLTDRMRSAQQSIQILYIKDFELADEAEILIDLEPVRHVRTGVLIKGKNPVDKARKLYDEYMRPGLEGERAVKP